MADQEQVSMDNITALAPDNSDAMPEPPLLVELPPNKQTIEPLDVLEAPNAPGRSKLRLFAILVSLYVCCPSSS